MKLIWVIEDTEIIILDFASINLLNGHAPVAQRPVPLGTYRVSQVPVQAFVSAPPANHLSFPMWPITGLVAHAQPPHQEIVLAAQDQWPRNNGLGSTGQCRFENNNQGHDASYVAGYILVVGMKYFLAVCSHQPNSPTVTCTYSLDTLY